MPKQVFTPHAYQKYTYQWILDHPRCGILLKMGLGKTAPTLFAIQSLMFDYFRVKRVLVIAPPLVASSTWPNEIDKWEGLTLRYSKMTGPDRNKRIQGLYQDADIYLINNENVVWLVNFLESKNIDWPFDMVIIDEWSKYKSSKTKGFKALKKVMLMTNYFVGLTGTPSPNGYMDLWSEMYLLDRGERLGRTITSYRERYFIPGKRNGAIIYQWNLREGAKEQIDKRMKEVCFSLSSEDWIDVPERVDHQVIVELPEAVIDEYRRFERNCILQLEDSTIIGSSAGVVTNKLLQIANGAIYDEQKQVIEMHTIKLDALDELLETSNGQPVLVFYAYQHDYDRIKKRHPEAQKLETDDDLKNWNDGKIPILLAHPASIGHGLNMQEGGNIIIWFGLTWSLELYLQANARLHRQGQKQKVFIYHIIAKGTVDEDVLRALENKNITQEGLLEALKARIKGEL